MYVHGPRGALAVAVVLVAAACDDTTAPATSFDATLRGDNEVPAVSSTGTATATFTITATSITYTLRVQTLPATGITAAHIHTAAAGVSGPVRVTMCGGATAPGNQACPATAGGSVTGTWTYASGSTAVEGTPAMTFDALVSALHNVGAYANVHTSANGGGEIRGQIVVTPAP